MITEYICSVCGGDVETLQLVKTNIVDPIINIFVCQSCGRKVKVYEGTQPSTFGIQQKEE